METILCDDCYILLKNPNSKGYITLDPNFRIEELRKIKSMEVINVDLIDSFTKKVFLKGEYIFKTISSNAESEFETVMTFSSVNQFRSVLMLPLLNDIGQTLAVLSIVNLSNDSTFDLKLVILSLILDNVSRNLCNMLLYHRKSHNKQFIKCKLPEIRTSIEKKQYLLKGQKFNKITIILLNNQL